MFAGNARHCESKFMELIRANISNAFIMTAGYPYRPKWLKMLKYSVKFLVFL